MPDDDPPLPPPRRTRGRKPAPAQAEQPVPASRTLWQRLPRPSRGRKSPGRPLTASEADELRPRLVQAILDYGLYADGIRNAMRPKTASSIDVIIWGDLSEYEADILANWRIARARIHPQTADNLRAAVHFHETTIKVGLIIVPRMYATMMSLLHDGVCIPPYCGVDHA